jgi:hypothetical protein
MSKARNLSDFISDATIDSTEIADLSVTHAKLHTDMNLSSKTLTFAANQISGNSVDGGVISNFASTGIDDNASATALTITSGGNVGIGIVDPTADLQLGGSNPNLVFGTTGNELTYLQRYNDDFYIYNKETTGKLFLGTANQTRLTVNAAGQVGIGTSFPTSGLHVQTDTNPVMKVSRGTNNAANINLYYNTTFTGQVSGAAGAFQLSAVGSSTPIQFYTDGAKRMEIDEDGNVESAGTYHYEFSDSGVGSGSYLYLMSFNPPSNGQSARADINITSGSGIADFTLSCYNGGGTVYLDGLCNGSTRNWLRLIGYSVGNTVHIFFKPKANAYYTPRFQMKWSGYAYRETTAPTSPTDTFTIESFATSSPSKPYVEAISTTNNYTPTSAGILAYNQAVTDRNGDYNTSTYRFICPANGDYAIEASFAQNNWAGDIGIYKYRPSNGTTTVLKMIEWRIADEINGVPGWSYRDFQHVALGQTAGDELYLGIASISSGGTVSGQPTYFSDGYNYSGGGTRYGSIIYRML